jgi:hypothetical protein
MNARAWSIATCGTMIGSTALPSTSSDTALI